MSGQGEFDISIFSDGPLSIFRWSGEAGHPVIYVTPNVHRMLGYADREFVSGGINYRLLIHQLRQRTVRAGCSCFS